MPRIKKNVTFQDIADYTHFSKTTISRYFNNPDSLTVENQDKIAEALRVLNYKENKVAKILASGRTEIIGLLIPNMYLHFYSLIMEKILETYEAHGYKFLAFVGSDNPDVERRYINELLAYKIEGLIIMSHTIPSIEIASYNVPVVAIAVKSETYSKVIANIEECQARGAKVIAVATEGDEKIARLTDYVMYIPDIPEYFSPITASVPLQLLAREVAVMNGRDVDKPRNLAKSVTVE